MKLTNNYPPRAQQRPIPQKNLTLPLPALEPMLEMLPQAAVLIHQPSRRPVLFNTKAMQLSAYTRLEQQDLVLEDLFTAEDGSAWPAATDISPSGPRPAQLRTRSRELLPIQIQSTPLPATEGWLLFSFTLQSQVTQHSLEEQRQKRIWGDWQALAEAERHTDLVQDLDYAMPHLLQLAGSSILAVYTLAPDRLTAQRSYGAGSLELLPEAIDLGHTLEKVDLWQKGKPPRSLLHQKARAAGLNYLASAPMGESGAWIGLLVAAATAPPPPELTAVLQALAANLTTLIQFRSQQAGLQHSLAEHQRDLHLYGFIGDQVLDSVILLSPELKILALNHSAERTLGYELREIRGESIEKILISSRSLETWLQAARQCLEMTPPDARAAPPDNTTRATQQRIYHRNGHAFLANLRAQAVHYQGQAVGVLILLQDLSELEEYRRRSEQAEQQAYLGEVTASFAHQIKNPINSLSTGIQLLEELTPAEAPLYPMVERLQTDCERLIGIVESGLSFIRPMEYKMQPIRLERYLQRLLEVDWQPRLHRKKIRVEFHAAPNLPISQGDERALQHLFTNLVDNACDAMSSNQPGSALLGIRISTLQGPKGQMYVAVRISDNGPGVPENIKERIYEPFFTSKDQGTGLGLAIVRRIVTAHAGTIELTSLPGGTIFQVCLPVSSQMDISVEEENL